MNSSSTDNTWTKDHFTQNSYDYLHNFKGDIRTAVWNHYDYPGSIPYKVLLDRDGNLRWNGHWYSLVQTYMKECLGVS
ncbi:hypothetical protein JW859_10270 [bacterium]|nr:hypothetical protein [bacterium]